MFSTSPRPVAWQPFAKAIRKADADLKALFEPWALSWIHQDYSILEADAKLLLTRTANALLTSLHKGNNWHPDLPWQLIADQMLVYYYQHNKPSADWKKHLRDIATRYLTAYMSSRYTGEQLDEDQTTVCNHALMIVEDQLMKPRFELTSTLNNYFIGILRRVMLEGIRSGKQFKDHRVWLPDRSSRSFTREPPSPPLVPVHMVRFYQRAHQLINRALIDLDDRCQQIIIHHYGLDRTRISDVSSLPDETEPLPEADFLARFEVAINEPGSISSLQQLASTIAYQGKPMEKGAISKRHRFCLARLIVAVVPALDTDPALQKQTTIRKLLDKQVNEARTRLENRRKWR